MAYHPWFQSVDSHRTCLTVDPVGWEQFSKQWRQYDGHGISNGATMNNRLLHGCMQPSAVASPSSW
ncbi:uncharacterized protein N7525_001716 [Penicillium rubens]|uniref:uncharacterized protein n=1 Tax=Penicillium rubens TaxID=1108849 RepID=UPI00297175C1|nr:uncharacterized protein N7525_001716 [Penicillium rubens]KAJ5843975.1 hypothetical protein N7525_001716 [Penicillium rubens]KAJ5845438.1 hypothetical protein N7534_009107 [Penicillium rubens]KAJ6160142.1 hypothetical protein N7497_004679 [Penicillium chrysogenum]